MTGHPKHGDTNSSVATLQLLPDVERLPSLTPTINSKIRDGEGVGGVLSMTCLSLLGCNVGKGSPSDFPLTRMKRHWLASFWCSWMVEKTDSTRQLKTRRNLERERVSAGIRAGRGSPAGSAEPVCSLCPRSRDLGGGD